MKRLLLFAPLILAACGSRPDEATTQTESRTVTAAQTAAAPAAQIALAKDTAVANPITVPEVKPPSGIYQFVLPYGDAKILHTIAFYPTTFRLQEEYLNGPDSVVMTTGTWAPSQGGIWLYKEQVVRGRYFWKGDSLQYFSPRLNKKFSLAKLTPASANPVWQTKKGEGAVLYGIGTEPFWSLEVSKEDSVTLSMPDWPQPLRTKLTAVTKEANAWVYTAASDSLTVTVLPYFCNDGMSDFIYSNKIAVRCKGQVYNGCGMKRRSGE